MTKVSLQQMSLNWKKSSFWTNFYASIFSAKKWNNIRLLLLLLVLSNGSSKYRNSERRKISNYFFKSPVEILPYKKSASLVCFFFPKSTRVGVRKTVWKRWIFRPIWSLFRVAIMQFGDFCKTFIGYIDEISPDLSRLLFAWEKLLAWKWWRERERKRNSECILWWSLRQRTDLFIVREVLKKSFL